ncbi:MAG: IS21 family transposase [Burkholderiales bacterium]
MNVLKPHQKSSVLTLVQSEVSQHEISRKTGVDRKTIRKLGRAVALALAAGGSNSPTPATGSESLPGQIPPPRPPAGVAGGSAISGLKLPAHARSACEAHRQWIEAQVRLGRNATAIYQELVDRFGFAQRYNSVKRFCRALRRREPEQFDRLEFLPGEEAQVDYGEGAPTLYPGSGRYRKPRLFVMTLRYSRRSYRKVVWKSGSEVWARLHEQAFRYFGGCPQYVVLDNLKEGVITPDIYEPQLNRLYSAMLAHYGVVADPTRVRDPNRKGTVESAIQHTQATALKGRRFDSLEAQNAYLLHWEEKWAAQRVHGRAKRQVEEMFQEERAHLKALPLEGMRYFEEGTRTVGDDTTIQVGNAWYAARPAPIGSRVLIRLYEHELEIRDLHTLELIRRHCRASRKGEVKLPDDERVFNPSRQTRAILARAEKLGPKTDELCRALFARRGREAQKSMWGIVALSPRYPARIVEQAASVALLRHIHSYKAVRALADQLLSAAIARLDAQQPELAPVDGASPLTQQHELIRPSAEYAEFFNRSIASQLPIEPSGDTQP